MNRQPFSIFTGLALAMVTLLGASQVYAGAGWGDNTNAAGTPIKVQTYYANSPTGMRPDPLGGANINTGTAMRKFIDPLPPLCGPAGTVVPTVAGGNATPLTNKCIPVAKPDTTTYTIANGFDKDADYYEIGIVEYTEPMHGDLLSPTKLRGYVQLNDPANAVTFDGNGRVNNGKAHYLGPMIIAQQNKPVRIKYCNMLPTGANGNLFIPVDKTLMGAGLGPDGVHSYTENRSDIHLHGGDTPWISDGTPHQWTVPVGETTTFMTGDSLRSVPDMPTPTQGCGTLYYPNGGSARLMFYHDHVVGLTRLNVYAGEAAPYLIRDATETAMISGGTVGGKVFTAGTLPDASHEIPLVLQDKTFVPKDVAQQDAKWDTAHWSGESGLWFPHVYETNQDPNSIDATNPVGRWDWGPWFWPVFPSQYSLPSGAYGDVTTTPEAFMDTPVINGTAYPTLTVDPTAYRFRVLNASNDRFFNLGLYVAANKTTGNFPTNGDPTDPLNPPTLCTSAGDTLTNCTEVKMVRFDSTGIFPATGGIVGTGWGTPDSRAGGVPDPATAGPDIIQIGTEGGFLPNPVAIPSTPVNYEYNKRSVTVLNVLEHGLYMGPAERADVVVDFTGQGGKTFILYNDSPAPVPAGDPRIDYYTGDPDFSGSGGSYPTKAGYGPNTRTIMQIHVTTNAAPAWTNNLATELPKAYSVSQPAPIIPEAAYNTAFGTADQDNYATIATGSLAQPTFRWTPSGTQTITAVTLIGGGTGYTSAPTVVFNGGGGTGAAATATIDSTTHMVNGINLTNAGTGYTSAPTITFTGGGGIGATATVTTSLTKSLPVKNKAIQELFEPLYGRMNATLGVELPFTSALTQTTIPLGYNDPPTEVLHYGQTQIWKITHNGVDTHPVHFHLFNLQVINRVGWDGTIKAPWANEVGWKETVKMNPLEDVIVAITPKYPNIPFNLPNSYRRLDPSQPLGSMFNLTQIDPVTGNPKTVTNVMTNYGHEYVWHCHILGHEENDFMRPMVLKGADHIGVFLSNGTWYFDMNGDGAWNDLPTDAMYNSFGSMAGAVPVTGDWTGDGILKKGVFVDGAWYLDTTASGALPATPTYNFGGIPGAVPVVGDWTGDGKTKIGVFVNGTWYLDMNGDGYWNDVPTDAQYSFGGIPGAVPVTGDWSGDGKTKIGVFVNGTWYLDTNGNGAWNDTPTDTTYSFGGIPGAIPVTGDWSGNSKAKIGVFVNGTWYLDMNGNGAWDDVPTDTMYSFGAIPGAVPVIGNW